MKKRMLAVAAGAVSLLALTAASSHSAVVCCSSGTVTATGAGFLYETGTKTLSTTLRSVTLTCDSEIGWGISTERTFVVPSTPDKDGILASALTALASGKKVKFCLSTVDQPVSGTTKGQVKQLHVLDDSI